MSQESELENDELRELLDDSDRTPLIGAAPVLSVRSDDSPDYIAALEEHATCVLDVERRGAWHGRWVELPFEMDRRARLPRPALLRRRMQEARPTLFARALSSTLNLMPNELHRSANLAERIAAASGLETWLRTAFAQRGSGFQIADDEPVHAAADPERDLARVFVRQRDGSGPLLWVKFARLSTATDDASLRLRIGYGNEGDDDAALDRGARRATARLSAELFPERRAIAKSKDLERTLTSAAGQRLEPSMDIVYWNRPGGGARFHHDAFRDEGDEQRGVLFVQLVGRTAWLALSTSELARRVLEFCAGLEPGPLLERLESTGVRSALDELRDDRLALLRELTLPGAGRLGPLVDHGPEFTGFLVDSGHAAILRAGDALLLPNHGRLNTAMHSVFCASQGPNLALSLALFAR